MPGVSVRVAFLLIVATLVGAQASPAIAAEPQGIRGVVTLPDGQPAANADVWLIDTAWLSPAENGETTRTRVQESTKTDAEGRFAFVAKPPANDHRGHLRVLARDQAGQLDWASIAPSQSGSKLRLALTAVQPASGRVLDAEGKPLQGIVLKLAGLRRFRMEHDSQGDSLFVPPEMARNYQTTTAADGAFSIPGVPGEGSLWVSIAHPGEMPRSLQWDLGSPIELQLPIAGTLAIRLTADDPQAGANREVVVRLIQTQEKPYRFNYYSNSKTDAEGNLQLIGLPPGDYTIDVARDDVGPRWYANDEIKAQVAQGAVAELSVKLQPGVAISGVVVDAETQRGIPGVGVDIGNIVDQYRRWPSSITTDAEGRYAGFVKPGTVSVGVEKASDEFSLPTDWPQIESGDRRSLEIAPIELKRATPVHGVVLDEAGRPVPGALVYVTAFGLPSSQAPLTADHAGRFTVKGMPGDDAFTLHAYSEAGVNEGGWTIVPERQKGEVQLQVAPRIGFRIRGRVVNDQGEPMAEIPVRIGWNRRISSRRSSIVGTGSYLPPVFTDTQGRFESRLLWPEDRYSARIVVSGYEILDEPGDRSDQQWVGRPPQTLAVPDLVLKKRN